MPKRRAFSVTELLIAVIVIGLFIVILLPLRGSGRKVHGQLSCSASVRGIHQGMVMFAENNNGVYPLPSVLDKENNTIKLREGEDVGLKDQTKNIFSVLIFLTFFGPEICVTPAESNPDFLPDNDYQYSEPSAAMGNKKLALWDPTFKGPKSGAYQGCRAEDAGNFSYAHRMPFGGAKAGWSSTSQATEAVLGNRGPWYTLASQTGQWTLSKANPTAAMPYTPGNHPAGVSNTLLIHGGRTTWEGSICYNDDHVNFETRPDPDGTPFTFAELAPSPQRTRSDNLFACENDATRTPFDDALTEDGAGKSTNNYLRLYAGGTAAGGSMTSLKDAWFAD